MRHTDVSFRPATLAECTSAKKADRRTDRQTSQR